MEKRRAGEEQVFVRWLGKRQSCGAGWQSKLTYMLRDCWRCAAEMMGGT